MLLQKQGAYADTTRVSSYSGQDAYSVYGRFKDAVPRQAVSTKETWARTCTAALQSGRGSSLQVPAAQAATAQNSAGMHLQVPATTCLTSSMADIWDEEDGTGKDLPELQQE